MQSAAMDMSMDSGDDYGMSDDLQQLKSSSMMSSASVGLGMAAAPVSRGRGMNDEMGM